MRVTYACYLELSLDRLLPGFFEQIAQYEYSQGIDRSSVAYRREFARLEFESATEADEPKYRQIAESAAERLLLVADIQLIEGRPDWRDYGRVTVARVEDAPNPAWTHGMAGENPAITCPKCSKPMVRRQGQKPFWGCSDFPVCRGSRPISP